MVSKNRGHIGRLGRKWNEIVMTEKEYIIAFYQCGITIPLLAEMYGKSEDAIRRIIKNAN
jgi:aryl-alcohol dehydrogenase-like predicted oxidoreductase